MGRFCNSNDEMKKVGEDMQKLSEQIGELQKKLAEKTTEADGLRAGRRRHRQLGRARGCPIGDSRCCASSSPR